MGKPKIDKHRGTLGVCKDIGPLDILVTDIELVQVTNGMEQPAEKDDDSIRSPRFRNG